MALLRSENRMMVNVVKHVLLSAVVILTVHDRTLPGAAAVFIPHHSSSGLGGYGGSIVSHTRQHVAPQVGYGGQSYGHGKFIPAGSISKTDLLAKKLKKQHAATINYQKNYLKNKASVLNYHRQKAEAYHSKANSAVSKYLRLLSQAEHEDAVQAAGKRGLGGPAVGAGYGVGVGAGPGYGVGAGPGYGVGVGAGHGVGAGAGYGVGVGAGHGVGAGAGYGVGAGAGYGVGVGAGAGAGFGGQHPYGYQQQQHLRYGAHGGAAGVYGPQYAHGHAPAYDARYGF